MIKYINVSPYDISGNPTTVQVQPGRGMQKIAKYETLMQDMRDFIASISPQEGKAFLLIAAMGDQNWGPNKNADFWPTEALSHEGHDYGYLTFEDSGHWYHQHNNDDVSKSFGRVIKSIYNPQMCRIELIVEVDLDKDNIIKEKLARNEVIAVSMGCFAAGTEILTQHCYGAPIESIKPGDIVYGHDGKEHPVVATSERKYEGNIHTIGITSRDSIVCTENHPIFAVQQDELKGRGRPHIGLAKWIKAKDLKRGDYAIYPIINEVAEPSYVDKWYAKLTGYYLAEGYTIKTRAGIATGIGLTCNVNDKCPQEIEEICSNLKGSPKVNFYHKAPSPQMTYITLFNEEITSHMLETCGEHAKYKHLSREVFYWSEENIKWFIGAYIDGDGCVNKGTWNPGSISISTSSKRLALQLGNLLAKIGIVASVNCSLHKPSEIVKKSTIEWIVYIGKTYTWKLLGYSSKLDSAYVKPINEMCRNWIDEQYLYLKIKSNNSEYGEIPVYNLEVDDCNSYIANGISVHNSHVGYDLCKVCHPQWEQFYKIPEPDMRKIAASMSLEEIYSIGNQYGVDLTYITELSAKGGPVGIHSTVDKYCHHMRYSRNRLMPNGERACVINLRPRLFDISWVDTNADKSAFVLDKVASMQITDMEDKIAAYLDQSQKQAELKNAKAEKTADIEKDVPGEVLTDEADLIKEYYAKRLLPEIVPYEKEIPDNVIDQTAKKYSLGEILSTFMVMGMFPHPREFQRIVLIQGGENDALNAMNQPENVLTPSVVESIMGQMGEIPEADFGISHNNINSELGQLLSQFVPQRSYYRPYVAKRIIMIKKAEYNNVNSYMVSDTKPPKIIPALLAAVGGIYIAAKATGDKQLNELVTAATQHKGATIAAMAGAALLYTAARAHGREMQANANFNRFQELDKQRRMQEQMEKTSSIDRGLASLGLPILGAYLWAGHATNRMRRGEDPGSIGQFVAKYPLVAGLAGAAAINPGARAAIGQVFKGTKPAVKPIAEAAPAVAQAAKSKVPLKNILYPAATIATPIVGSHLIAAHTINKANRGEPYNKTEAFVTKHPMGVGLAGATLATPALRRFTANLGKYIIKGASLQLHDMDNLSPIEQDRLICAYWEHGDI